MTRWADSLQARLLWRVFLFVAVVLLGASVIAYHHARSELNELLDGHLAQSAALLMLQANDDDDDVSDLPVSHKYVSQVAFQIFMGGRLITRSPNVGETPMAPQIEGFASVERPDGAHWRVYSSYSPRRDVTVQVAENVASRQSILWALMGSMLGPMLLAAPLLGVLLWFSVHHGLLPLRQLRQTLAGRQPQASDPVPVQGLPLELHPLVHTLNGLLGRIRQMVDTERRFTADAAHELRTPIAAIRAQAQVALGAGDDADVRVHALRQTVAACDRATDLVSQLLQLARLEQQEDIPFAPVDMVTVAQQVAAGLHPQALRRQQNLEMQANACVVRGDAVLLAILVRNLLDNALRYSPPGACVVLETGQTPQGGRFLTVRDSGPGMGPESIALLGQRFFRELGTGQSGSGLGWSIVMRVLEVHAARASVQRCGLLGGLEVRIDWPPELPEMVAGT